MLPPQHISVFISYCLLPQTQTVYGGKTEAQQSRETYSRSPSYQEGMLGSELWLPDKSGDLFLSQLLPLVVQLTPGIRALSKLLLLPLTHNSSAGPSPPS